jgi:hypothetical protein
VHEARSRARPGARASQPWLTQSRTSTYRAFLLLLLLNRGQNIKQLGPIAQRTHRCCKNSLRAGYLRWITAMHMGRDVEGPCLCITRHLSAQYRYTPKPGPVPYLPDGGCDSALIPPPSPTSSRFLMAFLKYW